MLGPGCFLMLELSVLGKQLEEEDEKLLEGMVLKRKFLLLICETPERWMKNYPRIIEADKTTPWVAQNQEFEIVVILIERL